VPEGLEVEIYRRVAVRAMGRIVSSVVVDERQVSGEEIRITLPGSSIEHVRRIGKLLLLDLSLDGQPSAVLGLHFGMTGRLIVDGEAPIEKLEYGSGRDDAAWDRLVVGFTDGGQMRVNDPRRWARFDVDPNEDRLGPDFLAIDAETLRRSFARRRAALKTVLLDQTVVAGFGNLCIDEVLWQCGLSPMRSVAGLADGDLDDLVAATARHLPAMLARGGSHTGTIDPRLRAAMPPCPRDGAAMRREAVGGRTTVWCPAHQPS
jgi:formamidopyrimidine-DNA glycosylase